MVTRVVPDGKRKVMTSAATLLRVFLFSKSSAHSASGKFSKPKAEVFYFFNVLARKLTVLFHASAASFGR
jgi:hypothetical protein